MAENVVKACIELPNGDLTVKSAAIGAEQCRHLATPHPIVGLWVFFENPVGNQVAEEWSGHELFSCFDDADGLTVVQQRDTSGGDKGARRKPYQANGPSGQIRDLPSAVADTAASGDAVFDVVDGGSGGPYAAKVASCRTLVGYPPN
jgi:hypothetical protein